MLGLVIPVFQRRFMQKCIESLEQAASEMDLQVCIVNDGRQQLRGWLDSCAFPEFVDILHLEHNLGFAGANNAGWSHLMQRFPDVMYLGSLNDDTVVSKSCFQSLVRGLENHPTCGLAGAIQYVPRGLFRRPECLSLWRLGNSGRQVMELVANVIRTDFQCPVLAGHCFVGRRDALLQVGLFDESYVNSCDDVDLSLSVRSWGWDLFVISSASLTHYAGKSRYLKAASPKIQEAQPLLVSKWGDDLSVYNDLSYFARRGRISSVSIGET